MHSVTQPLRILIVTPRCFPYMGGVENHVYQVSRRLAAQGVQVTVASADNGDTAHGVLPAQDTQDGVILRRFKSYPKNSDLYFAPDLYKFIRAQAHTFDVLHVQNYLTLFAPVAMLAARQARLPYVVTFHGGGHSSGFRNAIRGVQRWLNKPLLKQASKLIATARFETQQFGDVLGLSPDQRKKQFAYIPNGADIAPASPTVQTDPNFIISIGRVEKYKGHQRVVAAMPWVLKEYPQAKLRVLGSGPYEPELHAQVQQLNLQHCVHIGGIAATQRQTMADTLASAGLVTMLSEYETQPMAALEAIALGRQLLVADTSGLSELAEDGFARAIPISASPQQTADAMLSMLRHPPSLRMPMVLPTWDDCTRETLKLYEGIAISS